MKEEPESRSQSDARLLAHYNADATAPTFGQSHADYFQLRRKIAQEDIGGGMETQSGSYEIDERRRGLQLDARKIAVTCEIALLEMAADAQPIIRGLQGQMKIFVRFQFENGEMAGARDAEEIEDAVFSPGIGENLRVNEPRIERGVDARNVGANQGFEPAFRLRAVERVTRAAGKRMTVDFEFVQQTLERGARRGG